eukprot:UN25932
MEDLKFDYIGTPEEKMPEPFIVTSKGTFTRTKDLPDKAYKNTGQLTLNVRLMVWKCVSWRKLTGKIRIKTLSNKFEDDGWTDFPYYSDGEIVKGTIYFFSRSK